MANVQARLPAGAPPKAATEDQLKQVSAFGGADRTYVKALTAGRTMTAISGSKEFLSPHALRAEGIIPSAESPDELMLGGGVATALRAVSLGIFAFSAAPPMRREGHGRRNREWAWRRTHADLLTRYYANQWVVLEEERVVAAGRDPQEVISEAKAKGVICPYIFHVDLQREEGTSWAGL